jgi:protoporphyrinogen oxidase
MKIAVVGSGIAGMTAAYRLLDAGHEVEIFEEADYVGGLAAGFEIKEAGGARIEKYYHHIFLTDTSVRGLTEELGLTPQLHWLTSQMGYYHEGKVYPFGTPLQLLKFKPLPFLDRIWFGIQALYLGHKSNWKEYENITTYDWMKKYAGKNILRVIWEPLLRSKFGSYFDKVAMAWFWARVHVRAQSRKGAVERLGYYEGGFDTFCAGLADAVKAKGGHIHLSTPVTKVVTENGKFQGVEVGGQVEKFDRLVFAAATPIFLKTCPSLPKEYVERVSTLPYIGAQCLTLVMNKSLTPMYWLNISDMEIPFLALVEHTNFAPREWYGGKHLLYIGNYLMPEHKLFNLPKEELLKVFIPHIQKINPAFNESWVEGSYLSRDRWSQPVVPLHYSDLRPDYETPVNGAYLANMSLIYPEDRGTNFAVDVGNKVAKLVDPKVQIPEFHEPK